MALKPSIVIDGVVEEGKQARIWYSPLSGHIEAEIEEAPTRYQIPVVGTDQYADEGHSFQMLGLDLTLGIPTVGSNTGTNPKFLAPIMGNVFGADLTNQANYIAGLIGGYSITGTKGSLYPTAGVIGILFDGAQTDAIVMAVLDGDDGGAATNAKAAFGVAVNNNNASSGIQYGVDLYAAPNTNYSGSPIGFVPSKADFRFNNQLEFRALTTAITANSTTTDAPDGSLGITSHATGKGKLFVSDGSKWQKPYADPA